jgi:ParB family chromosome partitioning protein
MTRSKSDVERSVKAILLGEKPDAPANATKLLFIDDLIPCANHPFKLYTGERLNDRVRSIKELGVIVPVIVRLLDADEYTNKLS